MDRRGVAVAQQGKRCEGECLTNLLQATGMWLCRSEVKRVSGDKWSETERKTETKSGTKRRLCNTAQATACQRKPRLPFAPTPTVNIN